MFLPVTVEHDAEHEYQQQVPWSIYVLIAICTVVFCGMEMKLDTALAKEDVYYNFGVVRYNFHWWGFITCTFLHGGWGHLLGNMYFLWIFGSHMERLFGTAKFMIIYWAGAMGSMLLHVLTLPPMGIDEPAIGASGAISAVMGAFLVTLPMARMRCLVFLFFGFRPLITQIPAFIMLTVWFGGQLIDSLGLVGQTVGIAFWAHVGGFVAGAALGTLLYGMKHKQLREAEEAARRPLGDAWQQYLNHDAETAAVTLQQIPDIATDQIRGTRKLLAGILQAEVNGEAPLAHGNLALAVKQAKEYGDGAKSLTAYLQMLRLFPAPQIPLDTHKSAGFTAMGMKYPRIGVRAFAHALSLGRPAGLQQVISSLEACLRAKFQADALADHVKQLVGIKQFTAEDTDLQRRISGADDELLDLSEGRLAEYRQWVGGRRFRACRFASCAGGNVLSVYEVPLDLVEARLRDAVWEGNQVSWAEYDRMLYVKVCDGDPEPAWDAVVAAEVTT